MTCTVLGPLYKVAGHKNHGFMVSNENFHLITRLEADTLHAKLTSLEEPVAACVRLKSPNGCCSRVSLETPAVFLQSCASVRFPVGCCVLTMLKYLLRCSLF